MDAKMCKECKSTFTKKSYQQIYCSSKCRELFHSKKQIIKISKSGPLNKEVTCIECKALFVRSHSKNVACSDKCKKVRKARQKKEKNIRIKNSDKYKQDRANNINICCICDKQFKARNIGQKCCGSNCRKEYNRENRRIRAKIAREDINVRIAENLRSRVSRAIRRNLKGGSAIKDLGCTIEELKNHLESSFTEGMTWDNYGEWHIDHIRPLSNYDLTDREQFKKLANYKNLQPLWAKDNIRKGNK